ncbi:MAG: hypothetical protein NC307_01460 [Roseburia sp.]|nr:hypothetical protein [Roseburia sp.]
MDKSRVIDILKFYREIDGEIAIYRSILHDYENAPKDTKQETEEYKRNVEILQKLKSQILQEISRLNLKEKSIIFDYYIHGMKWEQVAERNNYSARQCKNIRNTAIRNLEERFKNNPCIKGFRKEE